MSLENSNFLLSISDSLSYSVYPDDTNDRIDMSAALVRLFNILMLISGIIASLYSMSASLSLLSMIVTSSSCVFTYRVIRNIYIDIRVNNSCTTDKASNEFNKVTNIVASRFMNNISMPLRIYNII